MNEIEGISTLHGKVRMISFENKSFKVIPIYHPAAMLYKPGLRIDFEKDFEKINEEIARDNIILKDKVTKDQDAIVKDKITTEKINMGKIEEQNSGVRQEGNQKNGNKNSKNQKKLFEF